MDVRCDKKLHGIIENGVLEVKCGSVFCGARRGAVVIHRFSLQDGKLIDTKHFKDPGVKGEASART